MSLIIDRLQQHYEYAKKDYDDSNVIGISLYGSQNYNTDLEDSDIDTKLLVIPNLTSVYKNEKGVNKTLHIFETEELCTVKDIRCFLGELKKQNISSIEALFTEYCIINPTYKKIWNELVSRREDIAYANPSLAAKAAVGIAYGYYDKLYNKETGEINCKVVGNLVRMEYFLLSYFEEKPYEECVKVSEEKREYIMQIRKGELGKSSLDIIANTTIENIKQIGQDIQEKNITPNYEIESFLEHISKEFIDMAFFTEYAKNGEI